jgi:hypothetical protein
MKTLKSDPQVVFLSSLIYRLLLITYPKNFQHEFSSSMVQVFRDCCLRSFHTSGLHGMISLWSLALVDYIKSVFKEYTYKRVLISASHFTRLSGWSLVLGSITFLISVIAKKLISGRLISSDPNNYYSRPIDLFLVFLPYILIPTAMLLLTIGLIGLRQLYSPRASLLGKVGLVAGIVGSGLTLVTCLLFDGVSGLSLFLVNNQVGGWWFWDLATLALLVLFCGIFIFGIDAVKHRLLPRWNFIPILAGITFPVRILLGYLQEGTTVGFSRWRVDISIINPYMLILTTFGLIALGYLLMSDATQEEQLVLGKPGTMG